MNNFLLLLDSPLKLFASLYEYLDADVSRIDRIKSDPDLYESYLETSKRVFSIYNSDNNLENKIKSLKGLIGEYETDDKIDDLVYASFFKALGELISAKYKSLIKRRPFKAGKIFITHKPHNYIHANLERPIREEYGFRLLDLLKDFRSISVDIEASKKLRFIDNGMNITNTHMNRRLRKGLSIGISSFGKELKFGVASRINSRPASEKTPFWFEKILDFSTAEEALFNTLDRAFKGNLDILVLPELSMDRPLLESAKRWLFKINRNAILELERDQGILMLVAGSFHIKEGDKIVNRASVLNYRGDLLWNQDKMQQFTLNTSDLKMNPNLKSMLKISNEGGIENIGRSDTICVADTPAGRIALLICIDFIDKSHIDSLIKSNINIFFVPAMTRYNKRFQDKAKVFAADNTASTFFANNGYFAARDKNHRISEKGASFFCLPSKDDPIRYAVEDEETLLVFRINALDPEGLHKP